MVAEVKLGERAQDAHVLGKLAARDFECLLGPPVVVRRLLVDDSQVHDAPSLLVQGGRARDELLL